MKYDLKSIKVEDVVKGFSNDDLLESEKDVLGYDGKLVLQPQYQRNYIYADGDGKKRNDVIKSIVEKYPLNVMYWYKNPTTNKYEVLDGQQRIISICQFIDNVFSAQNVFGNEPLAFNGLSDERKNKILKYELQVYVCEGTDDEKISWFRKLNMQGIPLNDQEMLNAVYAGAWVTDAKRYFSKINGPAVQIGKDYVDCKANRQEYLEKAISWINEGNVSEYMSLQNQRDINNANELWNYFQNLINWIKIVFPIHRNEMKKVNWGKLYNKYKDKSFDPKKTEGKVQKYMQDEDVTNKAGIYDYVLSGDETKLSIRNFDDKDKRQVYEKQKGICPFCKGTKNETKKWDIKKMHADHIKPWSKGGATILENCQLLCETHNRQKSDI